MKQKTFLFLGIIFLNYTVFAQWTQKANFSGTQRLSAVGFSIGTKGYIGTGMDNTYGNTKDFWEYNPYNNTWTQKANFGGVARCRAVGFSIGSKGYIGTGSYYSGGYNYCNDFWEYDPATNMWTQKANFGGTARWGAVGFSIGTKGYIGTGEIQGGAKSDDFWEYDPSTNTWTQMADFPGMARSFAVGFSIGSKGYIGTGNTGSYTDDFWEYDPSTNTWTQLADFGGLEIACANGFSIGTKGYIGTGVKMGGAYSNEFWEYDPVSNTWTQMVYFSGTPRYYAVGFSIGTHGYIGTGADVTLFTNDFWEYYTTTEIPEMTDNNEIIIFPNPANDILNIDLDEKATLEIINVQGQIVDTKSLTEKVNDIDLSNLVSGVYTLRIKTESGIAMRKLIKQ